MIVSAVIIARNEEKRIKKTVDSLFRQDLGLRELVLVDDGSMDKTGEIAEALGCIVVRLPFHEMSYVGRPELGAVLNHGLEKIIWNGKRMMIMIRIEKI